ncbi:MAG: V-type ATP synthase subunit D [Candidatus Sedimenticola endophacoides]|uniref:V-type ATP synthase subunit D n=1 Tax=Candidatus Sedimenticola endophacoides TaxID=2548426 RepID=A0A657PVF9_9GAMM|nr:MAG: V-type ATP synthase subunit D [Candidatus Sedimenticola endophacoides]OQX34989.1 MAG: V-type ATP synthase subunit D [Candidatus Sedimenticola endophacoides]OQX35242.1 MAG: V-type ATP synthase subunit D [Candidatus Sedimenticola endophacoides]OQX40549.1 MAG: V-type ATP synthase subunit D [Candidatus Sedimenticola endophacoides]OQX44884.1 MAG: V-type ATP synthase subunit D [Candidatus Sedimenticola endophacoides]
MSQQQRIKAPPTKNTLLNLKRQVRFLEDGHALLERKRELLTRLVYERIGEYRRLRKEAHQALKAGYRWLSLSQLRMGSRSLQQAAMGTNPAIDIKIIPRRSMGVEYPAVSGKPLPLNPVGLLGTESSFDETRRRMADAALKLTRLGEVEMALGRLIAEQRKAQKRVNALKYNIIPRYRNTIRYIESVLEEEERNTLFQIKVLREREQRKA